MVISYQDPDDSQYYMKVVRGMLKSSLTTLFWAQLLPKLLVIITLQIIQSTSLLHLRVRIHSVQQLVDPDNVDWVGVTTNSSFQGRIFNRTSFVNETNENYVENVVFDDISPDFTGITSEFVLKSSGTDQTGISTDNIFTLINGVFQEPDGVQRDGRDETPI